MNDVRMICGEVTFGSSDSHTYNLIAIPLTLQPDIDLPDASWLETSALTYIDAN